MMTALSLFFLYAFMHIKKNDICECEKMMKNKYYQYLFKIKI